MSCNVGKRDRMIRFYISALVIITGVLIHTWWGFLGLEPLLTVVFAFSPIYAMFGLDTFHKGAAKHVS